MREAVELKVADLAYQAEKCHAAALGHDRLDVAMLSIGTFCGVLLLACADDKPATLTRFRMIQT